MVRGVGRPTAAPAAAGYAIRPQTPPPPPDVAAAAALLLLMVLLAAGQAGAEATAEPLM